MHISPQTTALCSGSSAFFSAVFSEKLCCSVHISKQVQQHSFELVSLFKEIFLPMTFTLDVCMHLENV